MVGWHHGHATLVNGTLEKLAALVPLPHVHLVRYGGCLAPHSHLRSAIMPTTRPHGRGGDGHRVALLELGTAAEALLALDMARAPGVAGAQRIIAAITHSEVIRQILQHLQAGGRPAPDCPSACQPNSLRLVLGLTAPGGSPTRPQLRRLVGANSPRPVLRLRSLLTPPLGGEG